MVHQLISNFQMTSLANPIQNSFKKELKNKSAIKLNNDILEDACHNIISKKIKTDQLQVQE